MTSVSRIPGEELPDGEEADFAAAFRRADLARSARAGEDLVLLHLGRGSYFTLNETGAFLWQRLDGITTLAEIAAALIREFAVDPQKALADVRSIVGDLLDEELVERAPTELEACQSSKAGS